MEAFCPSGFRAAAQDQVLHCGHRHQVARVDPPKGNKRLTLPHAGLQECQGDIEYSCLFPQCVTPLTCRFIVMAMSQGHEDDGVQTPKRQKTTPSGLSEDEEAAPSQMMMMIFTKVSHADAESHPSRRDIFF